MKFLLLLVSTIFLSQSVFTQVYTPLVKQGATWINYFSDDYPVAEYRAYKVESDTIVNSIVYSKVFMYELNGDVINGYDYNNKDLYGLLREDTLERKIYAIVNIDNWGDIDMFECDGFDQDGKLKEFILYDFSISKGDTLNNCQLDDHEKNIAIIADTIENLFEKDRRVLINENGLKLIEGIGYEDGLFMKAHTWVHAGWGYGLYDYCQDGELGCKLLTKTKNVDKEDNIKVYPNPASSLINIDSEMQLKSIRIFNHIGNLILTENLNTNHKELHLNLENGLYFIVIETANSNIYFAKQVISSL